MLHLLGVIPSKITAGNRQQGRCVEMIRSSKLKAWVEAPYSGFLDINGNEQLQLRSPLSFVCSRLVYALDVMRVKPHDTRGQIAAIHFFCGEHVYRQDTMSNAISILNSLLAQLLLSFPDLDLTSFIKLIALMWTPSVTFFDMFSLLPPTAFVFCIINNLPLYLTDPETMDDAYGLLLWLIGLTEFHKERPTSCGFKLLLTSPAQFIELPLERLRDKEILHVREEVSPTGGFTELEWDINMEGWCPRFARVHITSSAAFLHFYFWHHESNASSHYPSSATWPHTKIPTRENTWK